MSQTGGSQGSFTNRLTIRQKLFFSFVVILIFILIQSGVSINAAGVFTDNYNNIQVQQTFEANSRDLRANIEEEQNTATSWILGTSADARLDYADSTQVTNATLVALELLMQQLEESDPDGDLNTTYASDQLNNVAGEIDAFRTLIENNIFSYPGNDILDNLTQSLFIMEGIANDVVATTLQYVLTNDSSLITNITGSPLALTNQLDSRQALFFRMTAEIADTTVVGSVYGRDINQTLFKEIETLYETLLSPNVLALNIEARAIANQVDSTANQLNATEYATLLENVDELILASNELADGLAIVEVEVAKLVDKLSNLNLEMIAQVEQINTDIDLLIEWVFLERIELSRSFAETFASQILIIFGVIAASIVLVIIIQFFINSQITRPVKSITFWSQLISEGDLSKTQPSSGRTDEIGTLQENFRTMNKNLREIIDEVQSSSSLITSTSENLSTSAQEINATAEEVSAIAQTMAKGSTEQAEIITSIVQELQAASDVVENVVIQITENLDIIKDLSEQTNILALNTAIEAANAGDMARGFQVIAENIRKMSEQSKRTSKRVSTDSREILEQLRDSFNHITTLIENVASVSEETAASAEEVAASAEEMTASMESIAASSAMLSDQSQESLEKVNRFKLD
ncbi:MAG: methyl-accepting chemotaxis protein [Candidatus Kariarchaeaceae archaeon]